MADQKSSTNLESYEALPYGNCLLPHIHPDRLATLATLFGMHPPPPERCRVLELGCADGANLIAMAQALPESEFLGVDFSASSIAEGQRVVTSAGLKNISMIHSNLLDLKTDAARYGFQFLTEADFPVCSSNIPTEAESWMEQWSRDAIQFGQYRDFLTNRMFRRSLLCRREIRLKDHPQPERLVDLHFSTKAQSVSNQPDFASRAEESFRAPDGSAFTTTDPLCKAAMVHLVEVNPRVVPFNALLLEARRLLGQNEPRFQRGKPVSPSSVAVDEARLLAGELFRIYSMNEHLVKLHACAPRMVVEVSEHPMARRNP